MHNRKEKKFQKENITMKKVITILIAVLVVTALTTTAFAFGPGWGRGHGRGQCYGPDDMAMSQLNLTTEQMAKINALREAHLKDIKPLQDKLFSKRGKLRLLWLQKNPDEDKILAVQKEVRNLRDQLHDKKTSHRFEVLRVLTPEQKEKYQAFGRGSGFCPGMRGGAGFHHGGPGMSMMRGNW